MSRAAGVVGVNGRRRAPIVALVAVMAAGATAAAVQLAGSPAAVEVPSTQASPLPPRVADPVAATARRPNVLIILTDDQRDGLGVMPKTRKWFERKGRLYKRAFVTTPLCCPSRASIMTGRYVHNHGVRTNADPEKLDHKSTIQRYLHDAGYLTGYIGKFLNLWDIDDPPPYFDRFAITSGGNPPYYGSKWNSNGNEKRVSIYSTRFVARRGVRFLENAERINDRRAWYIVLATHAPHAPYEPEDKYRAAKVPTRKRNPAFAERDRSDKPPYVRKHRQELSKSLWVRRQQLRTLMSVDDLVDRVMRKMGELDERRRTLAFFISDNGMLWGDHGLGNKTHAYTNSIQVPLLMRWPGRIRPGRADGRLAANVDLVPTILHATGIDPKLEYPLDGRRLTGPNKRSRLLLEYFHYGKFTTPNWASLRNRRYQYTEYYASDRKTVRFREYYDLKDDPFQVRNLLGDGKPGNNPDVKVLSARLATERKCAGPTCRDD